MPTTLRTGQRYLCHCGIETDLIFNKGVDLPEFSLYPHVESEEGRATLRDYADALIALSASQGLGAILESPTWMANADRAAPLNYTPADLERINRAAIDLMRASAEASPADVLVSACIGPRGDAYAPEAQMNPEEAHAYHSPQVESVANADLISGYTLAYVAEAAGIARAARDIGRPSVISFTVETDGTLPDGSPLPVAIKQCDELTDAAPAHYMINCAHPDHFSGVLEDAMATGRLRGLVVNASRCSHAELDEAEELDDGDPLELATQLSDIGQRYETLQVFGGCCGTDLRHLEQMAKALSQAS